MVRYNLKRWGVYAPKLPSNVRDGGWMFVLPPTLYPSNQVQHDITSEYDAEMERESLYRVCEGSFDDSTDCEHAPAKQPRRKRSTASNVSVVQGE